MPNIADSFASAQAERLEIFEGFPKPEWSPAAFGEYVTALMRCDNDQHCREVVTHFIETATKYPTVAVVLSQIRITAPVREHVSKHCPHCTAGWRLVHVLVESPGATPQEISPEEASSLMERIRNTKHCRSMVYEAVRQCCCGSAPKPQTDQEDPRAKPGRATKFVDNARRQARQGRFSDDQ